MDYKRLIEQMLEDIQSERTLKLIYRFIKGLLD